MKLQTMAELNKFDHPEKIRKFLKDKNITGVPANINYCPIAEVIKLELEETYHNGDVYEVQVEADRAIVIDPEGNTYDWDLNLAEQSFIFNFDQRKYPELIRS